MTTSSTLRDAINSTKVYTDPTHWRPRNRTPDLWKDGNTHLEYPQDEGGVLEVVLEREVDLAHILRRLRVVDVHVHQRDRAVLQESHLLGEKQNATSTFASLL